MAKWRDEKQRYKQYQARKEQVPALEDLVEIFEQGTRKGTPVREIVGDDPVQVTEDFPKSYPASPRAAEEQQRLAHTVNHAARAEV